MPTKGEKIFVGIGVINPYRKVLEYRMKRNEGSWNPLRSKKKKHMAIYSKDWRGAEVGVGQNHPNMDEAYIFYTRNYDRKTRDFLVRVSDAQTTWTIGDLKDRLIEYLHTKHSRLGMFGKTFGYPLPRSAFTFVDDETDEVYGNDSVLLGDCVSSFDKGILNIRAEFAFVDDFNAVDNLRLGTPSFRRNFLPTAVNSNITSVEFPSIVKEPFVAGYTGFSLFGASDNKFLQGFATARVEDFYASYAKRPGRNSTADFLVTLLRAATVNYSDVCHSLPDLLGGKKGSRYDRLFALIALHSGLDEGGTWFQYKDAFDAFVNGVLYTDVLGEPEDPEKDEKGDEADAEAERASSALFALYEMLVLNRCFAGELMPEQEKLRYAGEKLVKRCFEVVKRIPALFGDSGSSSGIGNLGRLVIRPVRVLRRTAFRNALSAILACARLCEESMGALADGLSGEFMEVLLSELANAQLRDTIQKFICTAVSEISKTMEDKKVKIMKYVYTKCNTTTTTTNNNNNNSEYGNIDFTPIVYTFVLKTLVPGEWAKELMREKLASLQDAKSRPEALADSLNTILLIMLSYSEVFVEETSTESGKTSAGELIRILFERCVFYVPEKDKPIEEYRLLTGQLAEKMRLCGFNMLAIIARIRPEMFKLVADNVLEYLDNAAFGDDVWNVQVARPPPPEESVDLVGLRNQGATCYMNSVLQQLFRVGELRGAVLSARSPSTEAEAASGRWPAGVDYNFVRSIQMLFASMDVKLVKAAETLDFCNAVKNDEFNVFQQMDAYEFYVFLFDRIDTNFAKIAPRAARRLREAFRWELATNIVCSGGGHVKARTEDSYALSLDIKGKRDIRQSLLSLVQNEKMYGDNRFFCSDCGKEVDATRRLSFRHLPRVLVIHLKRFEYSMSLGHHIKLNDYFEFPMLLDMGDYMGDAALNSPDQLQPAQGRAERFRLVGVVLHTGTSDSGHYVSIARVRKDKGDDEGQWFMFNDSSVTPFDEAMIKEYCFGSKNPNSRDAPTKFTAYMLFYERIEARSEDSDLSDDELDLDKEDDDDEKVEIGKVEGNNDEKDELKKDEKEIEKDKVKEDEKDEKEIEKDEVKEDEKDEKDKLKEDEKDEKDKKDKKDTPKSSTDSPRGGPHTPRQTAEWLVNKVKEDFIPNAEYANIASEELVKFIWNVSHVYTQDDPAWLTEDFDPFLHSFKLMFRVAVDLVLRFANIGNYFHLLMVDLKKTVLASKKAARWLLRVLTLGKDGLTQRILVKCPNEQDKIELVDLIMTAFARLSSDETEYYSIYDECYNGEGADAAAPGAKPQVNESLLFRETPQQTEEGDGNPVCVPFIDTILSMANKKIIPHSFIYTPFIIIIIFKQFDYAKTMSCSRCSPIFLIIRQIANVGPREREFLVYKRDFIFRAIMFCLDVDVSMTDPVRDLTALPILDDETISQLIANPQGQQAGVGVYGAAPSASNRRIDNKDIGFIIETISILATSLQFNEEWIILESGGDDDSDVDEGNGDNNGENNNDNNVGPMEVVNDSKDGNSTNNNNNNNEEDEENAVANEIKDPLYFGNPNEPQVHSKRNEEVIKKFIRIVLMENALWVDSAIAISVHMCISSKDLFAFFLRLFGREYLRASTAGAKNFIKMYVALLRISDGKEDWRRKEFTRNLVSLLKKFEGQHKSKLMMRVMDEYALVYNLTDHVLFQSYNAFKSDITALLGKINRTIYFS